MDCPKCGKEVPAGATFCYTCGAQMSLPSFIQPVEKPNKPAARPQSRQVSPAYTRPADTPRYWPYNQPVKKRSKVVLAASRFLVSKRLPALGGIAAGVGFFLQWDGGSAKTGWDIFRMGFDSFGGLNQLVLSDPSVISTWLSTGLMFGLGLVLVAALMGLFTLSGARSSRTAAVALSVFALLDVIALYTVLLVFNHVPVLALFRTLMLGWYLAVGGLVWMIISPLFARKPKPAMKKMY